MEKKIKIGLAPTRRDTRDFELHFAHERKAEAEEKIREIMDGLGVEVVNVDFLNDEGLLIFPDEAERAAKYFRDQEVDAVIVPHVNFGAEESVAILGKLVGKPLLLWGPRDDAPPAFGPRQTDTQCGLFASGSILDHYNVPFTYLENCRMDSDTFKEGLERFVRVAAVVKAFRGLRVGQISVRPRTFLTVKVNENELLEKYGIEIVTIDYTEMSMEIKSVLENGSEKADKILARLKETYDASPMEEVQLRNMAAMEAAFLNLAEKYRCTCFASECWRTFSVPYGIMPCAGWGDLNGEDGLFVACECDILGAVSSVMLAAASLWKDPAILMDLTIRHPENDNAELLWHCGQCPASMTAEGGKPKMEGCLGHMRLKDGDLTVCRFGGTHGNYRLFIGEGHTTDGPTTNGNYLWLETANWPKWERRLVKGPYIHHMSAMYGRYGDVLEEACQYLGIEAELADA